jgi:hypothetical protein
MKYILFFFICCFSNLASSQCNYSEVKYDSATGRGIIRTNPITLDFFETPFNGRIVLAYLKRAGNQYYIELEITQDSSSQDLTPICLDDGSRLSFLLKNNETFSIPHVSDRICGVKTYDQRTGYTTVSNYGLFMLTQSTFEKLLKSEVILLKIINKDYVRTLVIKEELEEWVNDEIKITKPSRFFIDNIDCMVNPKFD